MENDKRAGSLDPKTVQPVTVYLVIDNATVYRVKNGVGSIQAIVAALDGLSPTEAMGQTIHEIREFCTCIDGRACLN